MKLLIATIQDGLASMYGGPKAESKRSELDEEAQFLELKIVFPHAKENLDFWKKLVAERNYYGLLVVVDYDKNSIEYLPLPTSKDYDTFTSEKPV